MKNRYAIILAAGQGSRMKSKLYKVLHPVAGKPMVEHVIDQIEATHPTEIVTIVGFGAEQVQAHLGERSSYAMQTEQLGTGHAVLQAKDLLADKDGVTLVVCGDTPLLTATTLNDLLEYHQEKGAQATILTAFAENPAGYGRVIRNDLGIVEKIVEQKDATKEEERVQEINTGTYCFDNRMLFEALSQVGNQNAQGEYYLPDVIEILKAQGHIVAAYRMKVFEEAMGVNDRVALAEATELMRGRINEEHMRNGVTLVDPQTTYIDRDVQIGSDTVIEPNVSLKSGTVIGSDCLIGSQTEIVGSKVADNVKIIQSVIEHSRIAQYATIGPFSHLRPNSVLGEEVHIGNFVEVKNAKLGKNTKAGHLTYIGDAELGENINIGCGTIFVNYDGQEKHQTTVGDNVFVGCNANLVAPVNISKNTVIAAGTTVTKDVPEDALAIGRSRQENKLNYLKDKKQDI